MTEHRSEEPESVAPAELVGKTVQDPSGATIGTVEQVYVDDASGAPVWVSVDTEGPGESLVPLSGARVDGEDVVVSVGKDVVDSAPDVVDQNHLQHDEQQALYDHYVDHVDGGSGGTGGSA